MTAFSLTTSSLAASAIGQHCTSGDASACDARTEYCDGFEGACRPCDELCHSEGKFAECEAKCEPYLKDAIFKRPSAAQLTVEDLRTIQVLLVAERYGDWERAIALRKGDSVSLAMMSTRR